MPESCGGKFQFNILHERLKKDVFRKYEVLEVLGQGSMGAVSKVCIRPDKIGGSAFQFEQHWGPFGIIRRKKRSGMVVEASQTHEYALKTILLDRVSDVSLNELRNEISILKTLDHPNIIRLHEVYVYKKQIYMVLDLCDGGDLFSRVPYSEHDAARYTAQIASAVLYLHQHHCVHRDLKFENIMFESENTIKVIDFGLSKKFIGASTPTMNDRVGTLYSMAPQVLQGVYSEQADCWSMGVISYMLLGSRKPFYHKNRRQMIDRIMRATYNFEGLVWDKVSDGGKDFVSKLLVVDPSKRMTAAMALQHEWLVNREQWPDEKPQVDLLRKLDDSLCKYKHTSAIKMIALNVIAHRSTSDQVAEMRKAFEAFDRNKNGIITYEEFKDALESSSLPNESLQEIFDSVDINKDGLIMYTEFLAATVEAFGYIAEDRIAEAFDRLDSDDTGYISKKNLLELLGEDCRQEIDDIIISVDENKDGKISYDEFLKAFRQQTSLTANNQRALNESAHFFDNKDALVDRDDRIPGGKYHLPLSLPLKREVSLSTKVNVVGYEV